MEMVLPSGEFWTFFLLKKDFFSAGTSLLASLFSKAADSAGSAALLTAGVLRGIRLGAVEEGANIVRVGTALFGKRDYSKNK